MHRPNNTRADISSKHRLQGHYHLSRVYLSVLSYMAICTDIDKHRSEIAPFGCKGINSTGLPIMFPTVAVFSLYPIPILMGGKMWKTVEKEIMSKQRA
jgi:hypothetical protein